MSYKLVVKDAVWQLIGRILSALGGFFVIKLMTPYLGPLRYGDYSTIMKYFAIWSALADFGLYVIALRSLGKIKDSEGNSSDNLRIMYGKFVGTRFVIMTIVYMTALVIAYFLPSYTSNPYLVYGLPIGMLFSASFMSAGILQLPLQIFWKMEQLSIGLIISRLAQLAILVVVVFVLFPGVVFDTANATSTSIRAFCIAIFSVLASGVAQNIYVQRKAQKLLPLKIVVDRTFIKDIIVSNRKYGVSYYLSSFHTLVVLIFLSLYFPTSQGYTYTGIWALGLALIEIFLIVPSSLGNSLLHKVASYSTLNKRKSFGHLTGLIFWIGGVIMANFILFNEQIIFFSSGTKYLSETIGGIGSDYILIYLGIVLWLSFIKQMYNYLFVATEKQNTLFWINLIGVVCGLAVGLYVIPTYNLRGGIITQVLLEILFVLGALYVGRKNKILVIFPWKKSLMLVGIVAVITVLCHQYINLDHTNLRIFGLTMGAFNAIVVGLCFPLVQKIAKGLTLEEAENIEV